MKKLIIKFLKIIYNANLYENNKNNNHQYIKLDPNLIIGVLECEVN